MQRTDRLEIAIANPGGEAVLEEVSSKPGLLPLDTSSTLFLVMIKNVPDIAKCPLRDNSHLGGETSALG